MIVKRKFGAFEILHTGYITKPCYNLWDACGSVSASPVETMKNILIFDQPCISHVSKPHLVLCWSVQAPPKKILSKQKGCGGSRVCLSSASHHFTRTHDAPSVFGSFAPGGFSGFVVGQGFRTKPLKCIKFG